MFADLILHNGRIHTVDRNNPSASAVAIHGWHTVPPPPR